MVVAPTLGVVVIAARFGTTPQVRAYTTESGALVWSRTISGYVHQISLKSSDVYVGVVDQFMNVIILDTATGAVVMTIPGVENETFGVDIGKNNHIFVARRHNDGQSGSMRKYDGETGVLLGETLLVTASGDGGIDFRGVTVGISLAAPGNIAATTYVVSDGADLETRNFYVHAVNQDTMVSAWRLRYGGFTEIDGGTPPPFGELVCVGRSP